MEIKIFVGLERLLKKYDITVQSVAKIIKVPSIIYMNLESLIKQNNECENNPKKSSTTKVGEHNLRGYSMFMVWMFDGVKNKHDVYQGEDSMKKFCLSLKEHAMEIINFEKKNIIPLTKSIYHMSVT